MSELTREQIEAIRTKHAHAAIKGVCPPNESCIVESKLADMALSHLDSRQPERGRVEALEELKRANDHLHVLREDMLPESELTWMHEAAMVRKRINQAIQLLNYPLPSQAAGEGVRLAKVVAKFCFMEHRALTATEHNFEVWFKEREQIILAKLKGLNHG